MPEEVEERPCLSRAKPVFGFKHTKTPGPLRASFAKCNEGRLGFLGCDDQITVLNYFQRLISGCRRKESRVPLTARHS